MSRAVSFAIFFGIMCVLTLGLHYYLWMRLVRDVGWPPSMHRALTWLLVVLGASIPAAFVLIALLGIEGMDWLMWVAYIWMGFLILLFTLTFIGDAARLIAFGSRKLFTDAPPLDPERRLTLARIFGAAVALGGVALGITALRSGLGRVGIKQVEVALKRLPTALDGTSIVQLTDIHIGPTIGRDFLDEVVAQTNALKPDLVVITGDLVDGSVEQLRESVAPLAKLKAHRGIYFVTGNHEYYSGVEAWCQHLSELGIRVLRNERVQIGEDAACFDLAGVDDHQAGRFGGGPDLARASQGRDQNRELILLAHQPREAYEADKHGVSLQLSGHTHGGQLWPWKYFVRFQQPVVSGLGKVGNVLVYVSNGTGYWGPPMRLGAPAEITRVVLRSSNHGASSPA